MASSLALKKLLASNLLARPVYSFHPGASAARFINTNPFRDNDPLDVHPRRSDLAIRIGTSGPALAREWSKAKKTTKAIHLSVPDDEKEEEEEVKVIMGINYKLPLSSASRRVWMNETVECIDMLKDNGKVGVWGRYT
ncbi:hypothetical protein L6452_14650 [Arctium lappa]|uniref:Uncharacterized protein n=1 Tax=Arctium lappa TaxID=4217 RepID=A0ACB9CM34_ARCLA|nr:hypothetical protein L6452_14650 [Arctium lappa]